MKSSAYMSMTSFWFFVTLVLMVPEALWALLSLMSLVPARYVFPRLFARFLGCTDRLIGADCLGILDDLIGGSG